MLKARIGSPDVLHIKGLALHMLGDNKKAIEAIEAAIQGSPGRADFHGNLGRALATAQDYHRAVQAFEKALQLEPKSPRDLSDFGTALCCLERLEEGADAFARALELAPNDGPAMLRLARAEANLGRHDAALARAIRAMGLFPALRARAETVIGLVHLERRQWPRAVEAFTRGLESNPAQIEALLGRAKARMRLRQNEAARADAAKAASLAPSDPEVLLLHGQVEKEFGETSAAAASFERAMAARPHDIRPRWERANLLPLAYASEDEIAQYREGWRKRMLGIAENLALDTPERINAAVWAVKSASSFRLAYQGMDDRPLQEIHGGVLARIAAARYPEHAHRPDPPRRERPRVGFVSEFLRRHSIWKTHGAWITRSGNAFEKYVYYTGADFDDGYTSTVRDAADLFVHETSAPRLIPLIASHGLDVLVYLDHGMSVDLQIAAAQWLAPVQVNGLGHPVTSGLPTMTHAFTSALMEPEDGDSHYTERLVRLANTGSCYSLARIEDDLSRVPRPERDGGRVEYLCAQNLQKYLPRHDWIFAAIAAELPSARFHFIAREGEGREVFVRRLAQSFAAKRLDHEAHCRFHPGLDPQGYLALNLACDVFLDGLSWSGNNTAHEALACGLPIVTWPGSFMRARHCLAILERLGLTETVASSAEGFVAEAVRLGRDREWRRHLSAECGRRLARLFDDPAPVRSLEKSLAALAGGVGENDL
jgi:predicted O-linked N-acetylglucosamine transferase (SPINDLY family)